MISLLLSTIPVRDCLEIKNAGLIKNSISRQLQKGNPQLQQSSQQLKKAADMMQSTETGDKYLVS